MSKKRQPTLIENVFRYPNGTLYYRRGKIEESLQTDSLDEARKRKHAIESRVLKYGFQSFKNTFKGLEPDFIEELERRVRSGRWRQRTFVITERVWRKHISPYFGKMKLARFDELEWKRFINQTHIIDQKHLRSGMNAFLMWAKSERHVSRKFDLEIEQHVRRKRKIATPDQIRLVLEKADTDLLTIFSLCLFCALRVSEARTLEWKDVHLNDQWLHLPADKVKTKIARNVPFNNKVCALLMARKQAQDLQGIKTKWVFPQRHNAAKCAVETTPQKWFSEFKASNQELADITYHDLRATFEKYMNTKQGFTDMQKEKYAGADLEVQKRVYVTMTADDLRGIEDSVEIPGVDELFRKRIDFVPTGKTRGEKPVKSKKK